ncbi:MAG: ATP-grasp domain-containing protein [Bacteroidales bacterium]
MIFGAGINQLELIREAKTLGFTSVVVDPQPDPPGREEADIYCCTGGNDYEATREVAIRYGVRGIVTGQMEKPLRLMARLANELGFIFNSPEVTERCLDKWLMKKAFIASGVPCARGVLLKEGDETDLPGDMVYPVIIKPRDSYSSRGVYKCDTQYDMTQHISESRMYSSNGDVLIEEFLRGREYSVEALTFNGITTIVQSTEKYITPYPNTVETGHLQPADLTPEDRLAASYVVIEALKALGIENSASHTEIMLTDKGPVVIETGARLGGDFISSYLTRSSTGVSMDRAAIQIAMGQEPDTEVQGHHYSMIRYIELPPERTVSEVHDYEDLKKLEGVVFVHVFVRPGEITVPLRHSAQRPACIIVQSQNKKDLLFKVEEYSKILTDKIVLI